MTSFPKILYKYRDWENKNHRNILFKSQIFFSSPRHFNDPFDCKIPLQYDKFDKKDWEEKIRHYVKEDHPNYSEIEVERQVDYLLSISDINDDEYVKKHIEKELEMVDKNFGIFSLSVPRDNILMWSHYSNCHTGFCMGFDMEGLKNYLNSISNNNLFFNIEKVIYQDNYPIIIPRGYDSDVYYKERFLYKSKFWEYEQEYRILSYLDGANKVYEIPASCFRYLFLGSKMELKNRLLLVNHVRENLPHVLIFDSKVSKTKFELEFTNIYAS